MKCHSTFLGAGDRLDQENYYCITQNDCLNSLFNSCKVAIQYEHLSTVWIPINNKHSRFFRN